MTWTHKTLLVKEEEDRNREKTAKIRVWTDTEKDRQWKNRWEKIRFHLTIGFPSDDKNEGIIQSFFSLSSCPQALFFKSWCSLYRQFMFDIGEQSVSPSSSQSPFLYVSRRQEEKLREPINTHIISIYVLLPWSDPPFSEGRKRENKQKHFSFQIKNMTKKEGEKILTWFSFSGETQGLHLFESQKSCFDTRRTWFVSW